MTATSAMVKIRSAVRSELSECSAGDTIIVACSGGADSLAMSFAIAREAKKLAIQVVGITIDHQLQEGSSAQAEKVIEQFKTMGIDTSEIVSVVVDLTDGMEASARRARYAALNSSAEKYGAKKIFLGHTRDDQAEGVLLGLARGSGARSLSGMAPRNGAYIRPLLNISRAQTVAACAEVELTPWNDPQNNDQEFLRVKVREVLLPALEEGIGPGVAEALARSAKLLRDDADALDEWAEREFAHMEKASLDISALEKMPKAVRTRVLRMAVYAAGAPQGSISADHVSAIEALVTNWHGQGACDLPGGVKVGRLSGRLSLLAPSSNPT